MYVGVDIGATKTLVANFNESLELISSQKFKTLNDPVLLAKEIFTQLQELKHYSSPAAAGVAVPGRIHNGLVTNVSTLKWKDVPFQKLLSEQLDTAVYIENDATLGGLSEARNGSGRDCTNLLYITISTGVGTGIIIDGDIPRTIKGSEGGHMLTGDKGNLATLESRISGSAFKQRFGHYGFETKDPGVWTQYGHELAIAIYDMSALLEPDCVVLGGGMAVHYDQFSKALYGRLKQLDTGIFPLPKVVRARHPEMAVIYGCGIIAKETI